VNAELLEDARRVGSGVTDAALIDAALEALLAGHRAAEVDASYAASRDSVDWPTGACTKSAVL